MSTPFELTLTRTIPAPRETVFDAWLDPAALTEFIRPMEAMTVPTVEVDARVGGEFLIVMKAGDEEMPHKGEYRTIDRYDRLAFTWISPATIPGSLVTIDFRAIDPATTELTLHHVGFPDQTMCDNHKNGWTGIVDALQSQLS